MIGTISFSACRPMNNVMPKQPRFGTSSTTGIAQMLVGLMRGKGVNVKGHEAAMLTMNAEMGVRDDVYGLNHDGAGLVQGPLIELHRLHPDPVKRDRAFLTAFMGLVTRHFGKGAQPKLADMTGNERFQHDVAVLASRSFTPDKPPGPLVQAVIGGNGEDIERPITGAELNALV